MKTLAAVLHKINHPLKIEELNIPNLRKGQVLVKIAYSGICHTQLNEIKGLKGEDKFLPHTLGHEGSGIVDSIGPGVKKVKTNDKVVLTWIKGSGGNALPISYKGKNGLIVNSGAIATFLTYAVIAENRLVKIPDEMPLYEAALLGCAIPTGAGIIINTIKMRTGSSIAIFGVGGIGSSALLAAKLNGAAIIIAIDISDDKLERSLKLGATHIINAAKEDVLSAIMGLTSQKGVDYTIECAGRCETMEIAFKSARDRGGVCVIAGNLPQGEKILIDPFDLIRGKQIVGTWGGETNPDRDIPLYAQWYLKGKLGLSDLITHCFKLNRVNEALEGLNCGKAGRILIDMNEQ
ncbi:MAG: zinc-binding dehydrogenase [Candidatus Omnitrophica bacterium]|jgi:S-(hydroxymethyl)glutathione dehydrogenase/alcohol dehydrogenase|nr:zinc-binding dehydrogenase [Candidatus Omnitrophota bacterium]